MNKEIFDLIKLYDNIVIARHVGVDPDAMASSIALRDSIRLTFPEKKVYAVGNGSVKFNFMGYLDKNIDFDKLSNILLIVLDTPDKRRVDMEEVTHYEKSIKIDHHPFVEKFCDVELINYNKSSASEMVYDLLTNTDLKIDKNICKNLYAGIVADTNRFLFNNCSSDTFKCASIMLKEFDIDITEVYDNLYKRPIKELKMFGYMINNLKVTENGLGYVVVENKVIEDFKVDSATCGNLINEFNNVEGLVVWVTLAEDIKNDFIRVSIRSRGPVINDVAALYGGGGHALASGIKLKDFSMVNNLLKDIDELCKNYKESSDINEN